MSKLTPLRGLSEDAILEVLTQRFRDALAEEGIPERIKRRGWGRYSLEVLIQDFEVKSVDVGLKVHHRGEP